MTAASVAHGEGPRGRCTPEYQAWRNMRNRCTNPRYWLFHRYGGRGITVCARWDSYALFLQDMGRRPSRNHSLDRRDNDANYTPENCRWATPEEQARNRSDRTLYDFNGERLLLVEIAERTGLKIETLWWRAAHGRPLWSPNGLAEQMRSRAAIAKARGEA